MAALGLAEEHCGTLLEALMTLALARTVGWVNPTCDDWRPFGVMVHELTKRLRALVAAVEPEQRRGESEENMPTQTLWHSALR